MDFDVSHRNSSQSIGGSQAGAETIKDGHIRESATVSIRSSHEVADIDLDMSSAPFPQSNHGSGEVFMESSPSSDQLRRDSLSTISSEGSTRVDWEELEKTEEQEPRDEGSDEVG